MLRKLPCFFEHNPRMCESYRPRSVTWGNKSRIQSKFGCGPEPARIRMCGEISRIESLPRDLVWWITRETPSITCFTSRDEHDRDHTNHGAVENHLHDSLLDVV